MAEKTTLAPAAERLIDCLAKHLVAQYLTAQALGANGSADDRSNPAPLPSYENAA
jgi:hypothetical protein